MMPKTSRLPGLFVFLLSRSEYMIWHSRRNPNFGDGAEHGFGVAAHALDDLVDVPLELLGRAVERVSETRPLHVFPEQLDGRKM